MDDEVVARIERTGALDAAVVVAPLRELDPGLSSTAVPLAGGHLVLLGPGMYVNRGLAMGLGVETTRQDLEAIEELCETTGVPPEIEVCPWAHHSLLEATAERGYRAEWFRNTLICELVANSSTTSRGPIAIEKADDPAALALWQDTAAVGFGYTTTEQRRISDLYAAAVHQIDGTVLYLASIDGHVVGAASLTVRDRMATLGGMTTMPSARRQGVQTAMIGFRLAAAVTAGCDLAVTTASPGSGSERNLLHSEFAVTYTKVGLRKASRR